MTALKNIPTLIGGAAVLAAATIGLTAATASAVWDLEIYDNCINNSTRAWQECCIISGGDIHPTQGCVAPANMTQVPPEPLPPRINTGTLPTLATNAPVTTAPGSRAPGGVSSGSASR